MQAAVLRLARPALAARRGLATTADLSTHTASSSVSASRPAAAIPLSNVEAQWAKLSSEEKVAVHEQLEVLQKKDWKELSIDEKKAAYYVAFGPHGPRAPTSQPGDALKIALATLALIAGGGTLFGTATYFGGPVPRTINKEWEEASNERAKEMKLNPITGITSEGYSGKGFVVSK